MRSRAMILPATLALVLAFIGCSDTVVGTVDEASSPLMKKGGGKGPPGGGAPTDPRPITVTFTDRAGDGITSDASSRTDGRAAYEDGDCGVWANIGNLDDARMDPDGDYKKKTERTCPQRRQLLFHFNEDPYSVPTPKEPFMTVEDLDLIGKGQTVTTFAQFNVCGTLRFNSVRATRVSDTEWFVTTDGGSSLAECSGGRPSPQDLPFSLTIVEQ